jgi:ethanolamine ammonia-lyase small subunit
VIRAIRARTPARLFVGRAGPACRTATQLGLREDHAAAVDAVHAELEPLRHFGAQWLEHWQTLAVSTCASSKTEFLMRPDLGRRLSATARVEIGQKCPPGVDLQVAIGDGLSVAAVVRQVPSLLALLAEQTQQSGWTFGRPVLIRYCRVGVLNDIGDLLDPIIVVLLIGERPGLATAESLSAYLAYRPRPGHTDAQRNLISNIHARGLTAEAAAPRILRLADKMRRLRTSGVAVKEELAASPG